MTLTHRQAMLSLRVRLIEIITTSISVRQHCSILGYENFVVTDEMKNEQIASLKERFWNDDEKLQAIGRSMYLLYAKSHFQLWIN